MILPNSRKTAPTYPYLICLCVSDTGAQARLRQSQSLWPRTALITGIANLHTFLAPCSVSDRILNILCKMLLFGAEVLSVNKKTGGHH